MDSVTREINATFKHEYSTRFIIDSSEDYERIVEMGLNQHERIFIVIDQNVEKLYMKFFTEKLLLEEKKVFVHLIDSVEESKSIQYYPTLVDFFAKNNAGRYDAVVAVGGGIVIDLVSFTVSTYMRGLPFYIIATTLIGQTDASTAGKTCLNAENAKNLLGTFYYPKVVYNNVNILATCTKRITRQGLSEAFKYSLLTDGELLPTIIDYCNSKFCPGLMEDIIRKTILARIQIRKIDPLASNLGHTFGHALEKYFDYEILHGDAISIGTIMAINYAVEKSLMTREECDRIVELMIQAHLNVWISEELDIYRLVEFMRKDKKSSSYNLHLVMVCGIGQPYREENSFFAADYADVEKFLLKFMKKYKYKKKNLVDFLKNEVLE